MATITFLLPFLIKLVEWLLSQRKLNARQKKRLGVLLAKFEEVKDAADNFGVKAKVDEAEEEAIMTESGMR